jgi:hypothetical protein
MYPLYGGSPRIGRGRRFSAVYRAVSNVSLLTSVPTGRREVGCGASFSSAAVRLGGRHSIAQDGAPSPAFSGLGAESWVK